jgi:hypothetical protein
MVSAWGSGGQRSCETASWPWKHSTPADGVPKGDHLHVFALAQGLFWAGIAATLVMGLGTAITVATIAVTAVSAQDLARWLSGASEASGALVMRGIDSVRLASCCCSAPACRSAISSPSG